MRTSVRIALVPVQAYVAWKVQEVDRNKETIFNG